MTEAEILTGIVAREGGYVNHPADSVVRSGASGAPLVVRLFLRGCPPNVARFVVPVVVFTVNRMRRRRPSSYFRKERREIIQPDLRDADPSTTIDAEFRVLGVAAARLHMQPRLVFGRLREPCGLSMRRRSCSNLLRSQTTTTIAAYAQGFRVDEHAAPTGASTPPTNVVPSVWSLFKYGETAEHQPGFVNLPHGSMIP